MSEKRILCLGNSNTWGYDPRGTYGGRYPHAVRWAARLRADGWEVFNRGMNGGMVPAGGDAKALLELIGRVLPLDVVTLMFGTNDVLQGGSAAAAAERMGRFLPDAKQSVGSAKLLLIAPPPVTYGDWVQSEGVMKESEALAGQYRALAEKEGIAFANAAEWGVGMTFDGVHFTEAGHAAFYEGVKQALEHLTKKD